MGNNFKENIKKTPFWSQSTDSFSGKKDEWSRVTIEPFVKGFFLIETSLPNILSNQSMLQMDIIDKVPFLKKGLETISNFKNNFMLSKFVKSVDNSSDELSIVTSELHGLNDNFPGSLGDSQSLTIQYTDNLKTNLSTLWFTYVNILYFKPLGISLIKGKYNKKEYYTMDFKLSVFQPNFVDKVLKATIKRCFPKTEPKDLFSQKYDDASLSEFSIVFSYDIII